MTPRDATRRSFLIIRTQASTPAAAVFLREAVRAIDPQLPVSIDTLDQRIIVRREVLADAARWVFGGAALGALLAIVFSKGLLCDRQRVLRIDPMSALRSE